MTRNADIVEAHQGLFGPRNELPDAMIASAATAVSPMLSFFCVNHQPLQIYAGLLEWRTGQRQQMDFSANTFASVYTSHLNILASIGRENPRGYHSLKAKLFLLVS